MPFFFAVLGLPLLLSCGDLGDDPILSDAHFSRTFRYYYEVECRYDKIGMYGCGLAKTMSPAYVVRIRVDGAGDASLNLDGESFFFLEGTYEEGRDEFGGYFHFYDSEGELTLYKDGSELIFWDTWNNTATIYSYDLSY